MKRPKRLFTKNTESLRSRKTTYKGADACPVPEGHEEELARAKLESKAPVNGGGNYNRPKVAGIPCQGKFRPARMA